MALLNSARKKTALAGARVLSFASHLLSFGGTSAPGRLALALYPPILSELAQQLPLGCLLISATNGKTTTTNLLAAILEAQGIRLVHNRSGANLLGGIASTLCADAGLSEGPHSQMGLFETDEAAFSQALAQCRPHTVCLTNLFRDQLDRYGELELTAQRWREALTGMTPDGVLLLCADDPLVAGLVSPATTVYFGLEDPRVAHKKLPHAADSIFCPLCNGALDYSASFVGHMGHYACPKGHFARPTPTVTARNIELLGTGGSRFNLCTPTEEVPVRLPLPGLYNIYNALAAAATAHTLGVPLESSASTLGRAKAVFGRNELIALPQDRRAQVLLIKNPVGLNETITTLKSAGVAHLLFVLNDGIADGRDISWIWDADVENLAGLVGATFSGSRAYEAALRFKYAEVLPAHYKVLPDVQQALAAALEGLQGGQTLYILPTYTALFEVRRALSAYSKMPSFWQKAG